MKFKYICANQLADEEIDKQQKVTAGYFQPPVSYA